RLRELPQARGALIVALTGFGQQSDRQRALAAGFDGHLLKPVDLDTVTAVLRRRLGAARMAHALSASCPRRRNARWRTAAAGATLPGGMATPRELAVTESGKPRHR